MDFNKLKEAYTWGPLFDGLVSNGETSFLVHDSRDALSHQHNVKR